MTLWGEKDEYEMTDEKIEKKINHFSTGNFQKKVMLSYVIIDLSITEFVFNKK